MICKIQFGRRCSWFEDGVVGTHAKGIGGDQQGRANQRGSTSYPPSPNPLSPTGNLWRCRVIKGTLCDQLTPSRLHLPSFHLSSFAFSFCFFSSFSSSFFSFFSCSFFSSFSSFSPFLLLLLFLLFLLLLLLLFFSPAPSPFPSPPSPSAPAPAPSLSPFPSSSPSPPPAPVPSPHSPPLPSHFPVPSSPFPSPSVSSPPAPVPSPSVSSPPAPVPSPSVTSFPSPVHSYSSPVHFPSYSSFPSPPTVINFRLSPISHLLSIYFFVPFLFLFHSIFPLTSSFLVFPPISYLFLYPLLLLLFSLLLLLLFLLSPALLSPHYSYTLWPPTLQSSPVAIIPLLPPVFLLIHCVSLYTPFFLLILLSYFSFPPLPLPLQSAFGYCSSFSASYISILLHWQ